jgi:hypothetical protein
MRPVPRHRTVSYFGRTVLLSSAPPRRGTRQDCSVAWNGSPRDTSTLVDLLRRTHATSEESEVREFRESGGWVLALKPLERCRGLGIAVEHELADCDGVESRWLGLVKKSL